jgi:hypothetical protein
MADGSGRAKVEIADAGRNRTDSCQRSERRVSRSVAPHGRRDDAPGYTVSRQGGTLPAIAGARAAHGPATEQRDPQCDRLLTDMARDATHS